MIAPQSDVRTDRGLGAVCAALARILHSPIRLRPITNVGELLQRQTY
jgi:hypothetical protein